MIVIGIVVLYLLLGGIVRKLLMPDDPAPPQPPAAYPLRNLREIVAAAKLEADAAGELEDLLTDLQQCSDDVRKVVVIQWAGADGTKTERVFCSGGSETEALYHVAAKQLSEHKQALAALSAEQAMQAGRSARNSAQNDGRPDRGAW